VFFCTNRLLEIGENFTTIFPETQAQEASMNVSVLRKSDALGHFWTRNLLKIVCAYQIKTRQNRGLG
jgi:hypothetical protein